MDIYTRFCVRQPKAIKLATDLEAKSENFRRIVRDHMDHSEFRGLNFDSLLTRPLQRIFKYPLIFRVKKKNFFPKIINFFFPFPYLCRHYLIN